MTSEWNHFALGEITELVIDYRGKKNLAVLGKTIAASALMGLIVFVSDKYIHFFVSVLVGMVSYFAALYLFGGFKKEDVLSIAQSFHLKK